MTSKFDAAPRYVCNLLFFFSISSPCHRWIHRFQSPCLAWRWNWSFFLAIAKTKFLNSSQMRRRLVSWFWVHGGLVKRKKLTRWIVDFPTFLAWCPWSGRTNHFFPHLFPRFNAGRHKIRFPMWPTWIANRLVDIRLCLISTRIESPAPQTSTAMSSFRGCSSHPKGEFFTWFGAREKWHQVHIPPQCFHQSHKFGSQRTKVAGFIALGLVKPLWGYKFFIIIWTWCFSLGSCPWIFKTEWIVIFPVVETVFRKYD